MGNTLKDRIPDATIGRNAVDLTSAPAAAGHRLTLAFHSPQVRRLAVPTIVVALLSVHAGLLAYAATRHSPTLNEPGHLVAGLSYWEFGRFEVYRVNPPLTRLVAALPVLAAGYKMDWSQFYDGPGARPEFALGSDFVKANGERSIWLFTIARWVCIPFSLLGGTFCFLWGRELYGAAAGLVSLTLWCTDPNILAHAELITPDAAATTFGIGAGYTFWRWLKVPTWSRAAFAGVLLGLLQLSKMSWLFLFGLWPVLWMIWRASGMHPPETNMRQQVLQLAAALLLGLYVLNFGYLFDGSFTQLRNFTFVSEALAGDEHAGVGGNRFTNSWIGQLPIPLPEQYVLGLDSQERDFDDYGQPSYLRGEWKDGGWWYYYLYGVLVKVPHGTQLLILAGGILALRRIRIMAWRHLVVLTAPCIALFSIVSSYTEFNHHFRYVLPCSGFVFVVAGGAVQHLRLAGIAGLTWAAVNSLCVYPHGLAYFNELAGGPQNGSVHLVHSNLDWGQDLLLVKHWYLTNRPTPDSRLVICQAPWSDHSHTIAPLFGPLCEGSDPAVRFLSRKSPLEPGRPMPDLVAVSVYRFMDRPDLLLEPIDRGSLNYLCRVGHTTLLFSTKRPVAGPRISEAAEWQRRESSVHQFQAAPADMKRDQQ
ncbi:MAG: glycosyltransferase family 39 protein [Planctomycetota bacterium]|nr:glycosyltransferase family 39 protein [Planctomycetota bacterium]